MGRKFRRTAELCNWNSVQKIIYAKKLLERSAKYDLKHDSKFEFFTKFDKQRNKQYYDCDDRDHLSANCE